MSTNYTTHYRLAKPDFNTEPWHAAVYSFLEAVDGLIFQIQSVGNTANWTNSTVMNVGMIRIDTSDGSQWLCRVSHTSATSPTTFATDRAAHSTFWIAFEASYNIRGAWANSTVYAFNDLVYDASVGIIAVCITPHTSHAPVSNITIDAANWKYLCQFTPVGNASTIVYNNATSGLSSANVQSAIDEIVARQIINYKTGSLLRWQEGIIGNETGANAGSNFFLARYSDAGTILAQNVTISRATGIWQFEGTAVFGSRISCLGSGTLGNLAFVNSVNAATIDDGTVGTAELADLNVTTVKVADAAIIARKIASSVIAQAAIMVNGRLNLSVSGNALTIAVKTIANNADPSSADPVFIVFRDATPGNEFHVVRTLTAATSLVISSGSTLGFTNNVPGRIWIGFLDNGGTPELYAVNCLNGINIYALGQFPVISSTAEGGAGAADSAGVFYSTSARSSKAYNIVAYATWETALATAGTWTLAPDRVQMYGPGVPLPGQLVQQQQNITGTFASGTATAIPFDNTIPQITEGDQYMTQAIVPTSGANLLDIEIDAQMSNNASSPDNIIVALFQDATANALSVAASYLGTTSNAMKVHLKHCMQSLVTVSTTFRMRAGNGGVTATGINGVSNSAGAFNGKCNSRMCVQEIMG